MFSYTPPTDPYLDIVHEDPHLLLANKPSGLLSVPGRSDDKKDCLISRIQTQYPTALIVHRLDLQTSGLMVIALDADIHRQLSRAFEMRKVAKRYIAWISGQPEQDSGTVDLPLIVDWPNRPLQMVDHERGKSALTHWKVIKREQNRTLVALKPQTGRSHQLRVHMKAIGHPIIGDPLYAPEPICSQADRLLLHAQFLAFDHPGTGEVFSYTLPPTFN